MNKRKSKRQQNIKQKLMAAICMLLVSSIMMVSTTYAWFTLSTAPEVTGISTQVGANGNLEMALMPMNGKVETAANDFGVTTSGGTTTDPMARNKTWGNLVDVSNEGYGLDKIILYPATLNPEEEDANGNPTTLNNTSFLQTPTYGADGRVSGLVANALTGTFELTDTAFFPNDSHGVRAVGNASGMTPRQLSFRSARGAAATAMNAAKTEAMKALNDAPLGSGNGSKLANIAAKHATNSSATHTQEEVTALLELVTALDKEGGVFDSIDEGYKNIIVAYAASSAISPDDDALWIAVNSAATETATASDVLTFITSQPGFVSNAHFTALETALGKLETSKTNVATARTKLEALKTGGSEEIQWAGAFSEALYALADPDKMELCGVPMSEVKDRVNEITPHINNLTLKISSGAGVFADVADHCGDYTASVSVTVNYSGIALDNMHAKMNAVGATPYMLGSLVDVVNGLNAPAGSNGADMPITDTFGYIIDMVFRTNAADSKLKLQVNAMDRIYQSQTVGAETEIDGETVSTMGNGAYMTFKSTETTFSDDSVKNLMRAIRIVFFDPITLEVKGTAKLDVDNAEGTLDGIKAKMYLYTMAAAGTEVTKYYTLENGTTVTYYTDSTNATPYGQKVDGAYYLYDTNNSNYSTETTDEATFLAGAPSYTETVQGTVGESRSADDVLMDLPQNTAVALSAMVYLEGTQITNKDVSAGSTSVTGTMNLQFSSTATLTPMNYTPLKSDQDASGNTGGAAQTGTPITGTITVDGATAGATATGSFNGDNVTIQLQAATGKTISAVSAVTVADLATDALTFDAAAQTVTFTCAGITADKAITITVTEADAATP